MNEVKNMKFELKVVIMSLIFSFFCMMSFTYACTLTQKTIYVYQVGIYKEAENKEQKLAELKDSQIDGYCYEKDGQYYVLSMISEDYQAIKEHSQNVKGIIKEYVVASDMTTDVLLDNLSKGITHD